MWTSAIPSRRRGREVGRIRGDLPAAGTAGFRAMSPQPRLTVAGPNLRPILDQIHLGRAHLRGSSRCRTTSRVISLRHRWLFVTQ